MSLTRLSRLTFAATVVVAASLLAQARPAAADPAPGCRALPYNFAPAPDAPPALAVVEAELVKARAGLLGAEAASAAKLIALIERHRKVLGRDDPRLIPIFDDISTHYAVPLDLRRRAAEAELAAATRAGNPVWILHAKAAVAKAMVERSLGTSEEEARREVGFEDRFAQAAAAAPEAAALAKATLPEALAMARTNPARGSAVDPCVELVPDDGDRLGRIAMATGDDDRTRREGFELATLAVASPDMLGTESTFALAKAAPILTARFVDRPLYVRALARLVTECPSAPAAPESCAMSILAGAAVTTGAQGLGIVLQEDALESARHGGASGENLATYIFDLAQMQWSYGSSTTAIGLLDEASAALSGAVDPLASPTGINIAYLRTIIADAKLDDDAALAGFDSIVAAAIKLNAGRKPSPPGSAGYETKSEAGDIALRLAGDLTYRNVRRRFCADCAAPALVAAPALTWLRTLFRDDFPTELIDADQEFVLLRSLPADLWSKEEGAKAAKRYRRVIVHRSGVADATGEQRIVSTLETLRRRLPRLASEEDVLRAFAMKRPYDAAFGDGTPAFADFLVAKDIGAKREAFARFVEPTKNDVVGQFGLVPSYLEGLDALARGLIASGYPIAANVVFEAMVDEVVPGAGRCADASTETRAKLADYLQTTAPALVRLAGFAMDRGEWSAADLCLDLASSLIGGKLDKEWRIGNERAAAGLRDYRSTLRLLAQLRARIAASDQARAAAPEASAKLFADLQLAMLTDTGLSAQAATRRRMIADADLARDIAARDRLTIIIAGHERFRSASDFYRQQATAVGIAALEAEKQAAVQRIALALPESEDIASPTPIPAAEAMGALKPNEAALVLHQGSDAVYAVLLRRDAPAAAWISPVEAAELDRKIEALRFGADASTGALRPFAFDVAKDLYDTLLAGAGEALDKVDHLLIVADGSIAALPFPALVRTLPAEEPMAPEEFEGAAIDWLVRHQSVSMLPSMRLLSARYSERGSSRATKPFLGIGNPILADEKPVASLDADGLYTRGGLADVASLRQLRSLPDTQAELLAVSAMLGSSPDTLLTGRKAQEATVKAADLADYRILSFATHGLAAGKFNGLTEPGLVLTPPAEATETDDGILTASEIASLRLDADLVILSACNTATSDGRPRADGLSGLTRSFLSAGARNVVATYWSIPSASAARLIGRAIEESRNGGDFAMALRAASLALIDGKVDGKFAHPAHWAAFVSVGLTASARPQGLPPPAEPTTAKASPAKPGSAKASKAAAYLLKRESREGCDGPGTFGPEGFVERDLTGDGQPDLLVDHSGLTCRSGSRPVGCGFRACDVRIYVRRGSLLKLEVDVLSIGHTIVEGSPPSIDLVGHNFEESRISWRNGAFR